jgi:hypothetical protein
MAEPTRRKKWSDVKARLETLDRKGLVSRLGELYDANVANRRFLHSRLTPGSRAIQEYRRLVGDAIPRPVQQAPRQRPRCSRSHRRVPALNGRCIRTVDPGFDAEKLVSAPLDAGALTEHELVRVLRPPFHHQAHDTRCQPAALHERAGTRVLSDDRRAGGALPGVESAAIARLAIMTGESTRTACRRAWRRSRSPCSDQHPVDHVAVQNGANLVDALRGNA